MNTAALAIGLVGGALDMLVVMFWMLIFIILGFFLLKLGLGLILAPFL